MKQSANPRCAVQSFLFADHFDKPVKFEFVETNLSSDGGVALFAALDRSIGLTEKLASSIYDGRDHNKQTHPVLAMMRQRVYGLLAGYADTNDAARLRNDSTFKVALDRPLRDATPLASQPTLSRFENGVNTGSLMRLGHRLCDFVIARLRKTNKHAPRITIDIDPTDNPTHGQQYLSFFNSYYDCWCFLPLVATITFHDRHGREEPEQYLVSVILRHGRAKAWEGADHLLRRLVPKLRDAFPKAALHARLDGGFASPEMFALLEDELRLKYTVNMPKNKVLKELAEPFMVKARALAKKTRQSAQVFGEAMYAARTWKDERRKPIKRRVVIKAEVTLSPREPWKAPKDNPRFVITNLKSSPKHVYTRVYCHRGEVENRIKELHDGVFLGRTSCPQFKANQLRVFFSAITYVLIQQFRRACQGLSVARWQATTLRDRLIKMAATTKESTRRLVFELNRTAPYATLFSLIGQRIAQTS